jgi:hypothetical protein
MSTLQDCLPSGFVYTFYYTFANISSACKHFSVNFVLCSNVMLYCYCGDLTLIAV